MNEEEEYQNISFEFNLEIRVECGCGFECNMVRADVFVWDRGA